MQLINEPTNVTTQRIVLSIKDLTLAYQSERLILENLHLEIADGQVHGLVGINGSGKTSLLKCISGEIDFYKGKIFWKGKALSYKEVALLETNNYFYHYLTGREYLQIFQAYQSQFDIALVNEIFQLPLHELIDNYSTGMKKKLAFMALLSLDRPIIILDEPFNGIDIEGSFAFRKIINVLKEKGKTLLITSHIFESLTNICDQIHYLAAKKIYKSYTQAEFGDLYKDLENLLEKQNGYAWEKIKNII
ncbi:ATP-binding cassette domain-containing protein [Thermoflexibacter ruber]|uniref:ABC-2 type transport system ATP-binding protein n=1 Tax=Thermoflexibacter ruber TaxID=1003 RepID=A0A1I2JB79_9BACT|nr:ATP-binding cassette domain-containing protein [Thermoflexibacter ruber]SFF51338.1 ABC-2 type transport system ATP-binding protein [Thermoflexibacter ruber]